MNLTEQYPSRRVRHLLGFPRSLLYRTPADAADPRAALLRLFADEEYITNQRELPAPASQSERDALS
jgi:hypothetical protein